MEIYPSQNSREFCIPKLSSCFRYMPEKLPSSTCLRLTHSHAYHPFVKADPVDCLFHKRHVWICRMEGLISRHWSVRPNEVSKCQIPSWCKSGWQLHILIKKIKKWDILLPITRTVSEMYRGPAYFHQSAPNKRFELMSSTVIMAVCSLFNRMLLLTGLMPVHLLHCRTDCDDRL